MLLNNFGTWPPNPLRAYANVRIVPGDEITPPLPYFAANYANLWLPTITEIDIGTYDLTLNPAVGKVRDTRWGVQVTSEFLTDEGTTVTNASYQWQSPTVLRVIIDNENGDQAIGSFTVCVYLGAWQAIIPAPPNPPVPPPPLP